MSKIRNSSKAKSIVRDDDKRAIPHHRPDLRGQRSVGGTAHPLGAVCQRGGNEHEDDVQEGQELKHRACRAVLAGPMLGLDAY